MHSPAAVHRGCQIFVLLNLSTQVMGLWAQPTGCSLPGHGVSMSDAEIRGCGAAGALGMASRAFWGCWWFQAAVGQACPVWMSGAAVTPATLSSREKAVLLKGPSFRDLLWEWNVRTCQLLRTLAAVSPGPTFTRKLVAWRPGSCLASFPLKSPVPTVEPGT